MYIRTEKTVPTIYIYCYYSFICSHHCITGTLFPIDTKFNRFLDRQLGPQARRGNRVESLTWYVLFWRYVSEKVVFDANIAYNKSFHSKSCKRVYFVVIVVADFNQSDFNKFAVVESIPTSLVPDPHGFVCFIESNLSTSKD